MARIGIDIDNTLYDFEAAARQAYLDLAEERGDKSLFKGAYNPWTEWRSMTDCCGPEACGEVITRVHSPHVIENQVPYDNAHETLCDLMEDGHELLYISNRDPACADATREWLFDQWYFPEGELIATFEDKIPNLSDCQYIIDDRPKTLTQFVYDFDWKHSHGSKNKDKQRIGFGLAFPFNQALTDIPDIYLAPTWSGIQFYLRREGVLFDVRKEFSV